MLDNVYAIEVTYHYRQLYGYKLDSYRFGRFGLFTSQNEAQEFGENLTNELQLDAYSQDNGRHYQYKTIELSILEKSSPILTTSLLKRFEKFNLLSGIVDQIVRSK